MDGIGVAVLKTLRMCRRAIQWGKSVGRQLSYNKWKLLLADSLKFVPLNI